MTYAFHTPDKLCFILDLMHGGDLHYHLAQHGVFNELDMKFYAAEVILGEYNTNYIIIFLHMYTLTKIIFSKIRFGTYAPKVYCIQGLKTS